MSRTMGVPLPHQSHFLLCAPIGQLQLWPQAGHMHDIPPLSPSVRAVWGEPWDGQSGRVRAVAPPTRAWTLWSVLAGIALSPP
ncbi:hypothetical protein [Streptomyces sp. NBC_01014]|uniref:hypothetical protein n=1 Tax=Streptomyces sp. NBC_01014 TaxID=2903719 RepID=UPI00386E077D|nr:hypothetical protein OG282_23380 [Streptomyces sp. NBC_01014]